MVGYPHCAPPYAPSTLMHAHIPRLRPQQHQGTTPTPKCCLRAHSIGSLPQTSDHAASTKQPTVSQQLLARLHMSIVADAAHVRLPDFPAPPACSSPQPRTADSCPCHYLHVPHPIDCMENQKGVLYSASRLRLNAPASFSGTALPACTWLSKKYSSCTTSSRCRLSSSATWEHAAGQGR